MKSLFSIIVLFAFHFSHAAPAPKSATQRDVVGFKGLLYYHGTGEWSQNIFDKDFHIWNAVIGEGSLKGPAENTMFVVEAKGEKDDQVKIKITQTFKNKTKTVLETTKKFAFLKDGETMKVPVLVNDTNAGDYTITATVVDHSGNPVSKPKSATVKFDGGE